MRNIILSVTAAALFTIVSVPAYATSSAAIERMQQNVAQANGLLNYSGSTSQSAKTSDQAFAMPGASNPSEVNARAIERSQSSHAGEGSSLNY
jgi:hypothetical protein